MTHKYISIWYFFVCFFIIATYEVGIDLKMSYLSPREQEEPETNKKGLDKALFRGRQTQRRRLKGDSV